MIQFHRRTLLLGAAAAGAYATVRSDYAFAQAAAGPFKQEPLPYPANKNEPHIDAQTMEIHHGKHHVAYINNLNKVASEHEQVFKKPLNEILQNLNSVPEKIRTTVRNNGGGNANHTMFWQIMG